MSHFKEAAKTWDKDSTINRNRIFAEAIVSKLDRNQLRTLDFGCGTGLLSQFLIDKISYLIGIDTTQEMLDQFNEKFADFKRFETHCLNIEENDIPKEFGKFDLIISAMAFHHLKNPIQGLAKLVDILNQEGEIFIIDLEKEDGSFHPDNKKMGVHHFGFSSEDHQAWAKELNLKFERKAIFSIEKNDRSYDVIMAHFSRN
ncbi:MAG: class I SAM-dependent methyltransferase [Bdellovibrio sp.]